MRALITAVFLWPIAAFGEDQELEEPGFALATNYFDSFQASLDYYPFTVDLKTIDDAIAGEYSYSWSIGSPRVRHVIEAACLGDYDRVLLGWWRSTDRATRVAALAVIHCTNRKHDMSPFPRFDRDIERFSKEEAEERLAELEFVRRNLQYFQKWQLDLVSDDLPKDAGFLKLLTGNK